MDQNNSKKSNMQWYDYSVFALPVLLFAFLGWESAFNPDPSAGHKQHDLRAIAHWFDPVFFQYNLILALLLVLLVPSLALSYIMNMAYRKEQRLYREVPAERRNEVRRRMERRASFSAYRGSVWLTTAVVLLGFTSLLFVKPDLCADGKGLDIASSANILLAGPFFESFKTHPDAYFSHLFRSVTAFHFGFLGAYVYFIGTIGRAYFTLDLTSHTFFDGGIRMIIASLIALVVSFSFGVFLPGERTYTSAPTPHGNDLPAICSTGKPLSPILAPTVDTASPGASPTTDLEIPAGLHLLPVLAFFFGFYPKRATLAIERLALKAMRRIVPSNSYRALPLSMLAGMSYAHELRLEREGYDNVENLINADAVDLAVRTSFSYTQLQQWIDQATLAAHLREDYPGFVARTGIEGSGELCCFLRTCDSAKVDGVEKLVAALSADPAVASTWRVRLMALQILLDVNTAPPKKPYGTTDESNPDRVT